MKNFFTFLALQIVPKIAREGRGALTSFGTHAILLLSQSDAQIEIPKYEARNNIKFSKYQ